MFGGGGREGVLDTPLSLSPLQPDVAFLYHLKTSETFRFSDIFRGYRKATPGCNGLNVVPGCRSVIAVSAILNLVGVHLKLFGF